FAHPLPDVRSTSQSRLSVARVACPFSAQEPTCGITRLPRRSDGGVHPCATEFFISDQAHKHVRRNELPKLLPRGPAALLGPSLIQLTGNRQSWSKPSLDSGSGGSLREPKNVIPSRMSRLFGSHYQSMIGCATRARHCAWGFPRR